MRTVVASLPNTSDRVVGSEAAGIPRRVKETSLLLSAHPWIYSVSQRLESPAVSATWYGHDYLRSFGRAHREQPSRDIRGAALGTGVRSFFTPNLRFLRRAGPGQPTSRAQVRGAWSMLFGRLASDRIDRPQPAMSRRSAGEA